MLHISYQPADAKTVQMRAFFKAVILSASATRVLYESSLYLTADSINFLLKSRTLA